MQAAIRETALFDIDFGISSKRFGLRPDQAESAMALMSGSTLAGMKLILSSAEAPLRAGENVAELTLRAFGIETGEAASLARTVLIPPND